MIHTNVTVPVGAIEMPAYLARPTGSGPHPAVIVLQEIFGVNEEMRRIADLLASVGYVAIAINFYHRIDPHFSAPYDDAGAARGYAAAAAVTRQSLTEDLAATLAWLKRQDFVKAGKVATWGFCLGGAVAFLSATLGDVSGAVCFYGGQITRPFPSGEPGTLDAAHEIACPVLLCYGAEDGGIPPDAIERVRATLGTAQKEHQIQIYPAVGHAYFRHGKSRATHAAGTDSDEALAQAVADSWNLVQTFLRRVFA